MLIESYCTRCRVAATWRVRQRGTALYIDVVSKHERGTFVCQHWRDHHEAVSRLAWRQERGQTSKFGVARAKRLPEPQTDA